MIDVEAHKVNFLNIFHSSNIEYNLFSICIIKTTASLVFAKKEKRTVFDNKFDVTLVEIQMKTRYLVDAYLDVTHQAVFSFYNLL